MAGRGSRFSKEGYSLPKPLINVHSVPMIRLVIENIRPSHCDHRFIFLTLQEHIEKYSVAEKLKTWAGSNTIIVPVDQVTEGAACTVLLAKKHIDNKDPLMIANSDQWVDFNANDYIKTMDDRSLDGLIMTMKANDPKWSFVKLNSNNLVTDVVEKVVVSDEASVGIYNFKRGSDFVMGAERMIAMNKRTNNEFYVAPVYNELIAQGQKIGIYNVGTDVSGMYGLGTPEDLNRFLSINKSKDAIRNLEV